MDRFTVFLIQQLHRVSFITRRYSQTQEFQDFLQHQKSSSRICRRLRHKNNIYSYLIFTNFNYLKHMENTKKVAANAATAFNTTNEYATLYDLRMSEHFTLRNLALSGAVIRHRIANVPTTEETERLRALCENVLEPLRRRFGVIRVVNGYHSEELCRLTGSDNTSQHRLGEEADIHVSSMEVAQKMHDFIKANLIYDQLRLEAKPKTCTIILHVSYKVVRG